MNKVENTVANGDFFCFWAISLFVTVFSTLFNYYTCTIIYRFGVCGKGLKHVGLAEDWFI